MTASELLAIAAHLHVAMRRKMGRVTDVEWMASNAEYALAMTHLAQTHALGAGDEDLSKWAQRLTDAWAARAPAKSTAPTAPRAPQPATESGRYVVGLRC